MRFLVATALVATCLGCAGTETRAPAEPRSRTLALIDAGRAGQYDIELIRESSRMTGWIDASPEQIWTHLPAVYQDLGIESDQLSLLDPATHRIGIANRRVTRLAGKRLSLLLDCGPSLGADKADRGQTTVSLTTWLEPAAERTAVHTRFEAVSRDAGTSTTPALCSTRGALEEEIIKRLILRLAFDG